MDQRLYIFDLSRLLSCLLYTSDAADERSSVDLGGRRIIKKKKHTHSVDFSTIQCINTTIITRHQRNYGITSTKPTEKDAEI